MASGKKSRKDHWASGDTGRGRSRWRSLLHQVHYCHHHRWKQQKDQNKDVLVPAWCTVLAIMIQYSLPGHTKPCENVNPYLKLCVQIFIATFLTYSNFFWPKTEITLMPLNWWLDRQLWYIHTLECYSAIRRNKILLYITTWVHLKTIMLSKRNQMLWSHIEWFFLYGILEMAKS